MNRQDFDNFTKQLTENIKKYHSVKGLVAVGSMSAVDYQPDNWSDHDFYLVTEGGHQDYFRKNLQWLPMSGEISFFFQETDHGVKVVYKSGHLLEFAVFDLDELFLARVNRYRVLLDRCDIVGRMGKIREMTERSCNGSVPDNRFLAGQFLTNLLVGVGRFRRGEKISANFFIKQSALENLLKLVIKNISADNKDLLDNINHRRRFEFVYPQLGEEMNELLLLTHDETAKGFLKIYKEVIMPKVQDFSKENIEVIEAYIG